MCYCLHYHDYKARHLDGDEVLLVFDRYYVLNISEIVRDHWNKATCDFLYEFKPPIQIYQEHPK